MVFGFGKTLINQKLCSSSLFNDPNTIPKLSIIIPTYNESDNILELVDSIKTNIDNSLSFEIIIVDDNSPDGTGKLVDDYIKKSIFNQSKIPQQVRIIHRKQKEGLIQAVLHGINFSLGTHILIMDADFSHPPETLCQVIDRIKENDNCIIVASRYIKGGSIVGWTLKRRLISLGANKLARLFLDIGSTADPMSGFFAFPKRSIENINFNTKGYKILVELLVKYKNTKVIEIPYTFSDRKKGKSKMNYITIVNYVLSLWKLYRYDQNTKSNLLDKKNSVKFFSKVGRFFTVGAIGLLINFLVSISLSSGLLAKLWYIESTSIGIIVSITSNFILNKLWTFEDKNFSLVHTTRQYLLFLIISSLVASLQLGLVYVLVESRIPFERSLLLAIIISSIGNFILNKKITFKEKIWR